MTTAARGRGRRLSEWAATEHGPPGPRAVSRVPLALAPSEDPRTRRVRRAVAAGPPPRPSTEPITVTRRASNSGVIMIAGQKIALGRTHAHQELSVCVADHTITVELDDGGHRTFRRTTTDPVRNHKAQKPPPTTPQAPRRQA